MKYNLGNLEYLDEYIYIIYEKVKKELSKDFYEDDIDEALFNIYIKLKIYAQETGIIQTIDSRQNTDPKPQSTEDSKPSIDSTPEENTTRKEEGKAINIDIANAYFLYLKKATRNGLLDQSKRRKYEAAAIEKYRIATPTTLQPWEAKGLNILYGYKLVHKLPKRQREVFLLKHVDDYTYKQIGKILGINESTVKSTIRAARLNLKKLIRATVLNDIF